MNHSIRTVPVFMICMGILLSSGKTFSQSTPNDSFYVKAMEHSIALYHQSFAKGPALYNGSMYYNYPFNFEEGQPYFHATEMTRGSVLYDDVLYDSVIMQYDEVEDAVVLQVLPDRIQLRNEKVNSFHLYGANFVKRENIQNTPRSKPAGFYNLLYRGGLNLLKKEIKIIREEVPYNGTLLMFVDTKEYYYIEKNGVLNAVGSVNDLYQIFGDHKKELKEYIRTNKLSFRKGRQNLLVKVTAYYDSLK